MKRILIPLAGLCLLTACNPSSKKQAGDSDIQTELSEVFPESPSREAYEGFQWQTVTGAGLRLWAQCNENLRIVTDASIPGARKWPQTNFGPSYSDIGYTGQGHPFTYPVPAVSPTYSHG